MTPPEKNLSLHGTCRDIWLRVRSSLRRVLADGAGLDYRLTGGSVLNAAWNHRESTDVDILVQNLPERELDELLGRIAEDTGGEYISHPLRIQRSIVWQSRDEDEYLDVLVDTDPRISRPAETRLIEGIRENTSETAEIIFRKLRGRGANAPVRDIFDIEKTAERDPAALERATNGLNRLQFTRCETGLNTPRTEVDDDLQRHASRHGIEPSDLATEVNRSRETARTAVRKADYESFTITVRNGTAAVSTRSGFGERNTSWSDPARTETEMRKGWHDMALAARGYDPTRTIEKISTAMGSGDELTIAVTDTSRKTPEIGRTEIDAPLRPAARASGAADPSDHSPKR